MENGKFQDLVLEHLVKLTQDNTEIKPNMTQVKDSIMWIENERGEKLRALFDAREVHLDINERILDTLNRIEGKVDRLTLKLPAQEALSAK